MFFSDYHKVGRSLFSGGARGVWNPLCFPNGYVTDLVSIKDLWVKTIALLISLGFNVILGLATPLL